MCSKHEDHDDDKMNKLAISFVNFLLVEIFLTLIHQNFSPSNFCAIWYFKISIIKGENLCPLDNSWLAMGNSGRKNLSSLWSFVKFTIVPPPNFPSVRYIASYLLFVLHNKSHDDTNT